MKTYLAGNGLPRRIRALVRQVGSETLVINLQHNKATCLNEMAASVWKLCDGKNTISDISRTLSDRHGTAVQENATRLALVQLEKAGLFSTQPDHRDELQSDTRRTLIKRLSVTSLLALPAVASVVIPLPAAAASCRPNGNPCTSNAQCCSGRCNPGRHCGG